MNVVYVTIILLICVAFPSTLYVSPLSAWIGVSEITTFFGIVFLSLLLPAAIAAVYHVYFEKKKDW